MSAVDIPVVADARGVAAALAAGAEWLWWQDAPERTRPEEGALEALLEASRTHRNEEAPLLVASRVRDLTGRTIGPTYRPDFGALDEVVRRADVRLVPVGAVATASALVHRDAVAAHGLPRPDLGRHAGYEWTHRILGGGRVGWLAAGSVVRVGPTTGAGRPADVRATLRTARSGAWGRAQAARATLDAMSSRHRI